MLFRSGFTPRRLRADETASFIDLGLGITNLVARATATAAEVRPEKLRAGADRLRRLVQVTQPRAVAILGVTAFRTAFDRPRAVLGRQAADLEGALLWVLPNPSGLNAHYQLEALAAAYRELREALDRGAITTAAEAMVR